MSPYDYPNQKIAMQSYFTGYDPKKIAAVKSQSGGIATLPATPTVSPVANTEDAFDNAVQNVRRAKGAPQTMGALAGGSIKTVYGAAQDALTYPARGIASAGQGIYDFADAAINGVVPQASASAPANTAAVQATPAPQTAIPAVPQQTISQPIAQSAIDPETGAINKLSNDLRSPIAAAGNNFVQRGNAGLNALASNPNTLQDFNDLQDVRGNGISATRDANGQMTFSNNPNVQPKLPVGTQGFDLAGANQRMQASLANNANIDRDKTIADLAGSIAATSGRKRNALVQQYNDLLRVKDQQGSAIADIGYKTAQTGLANAQTQGATTQNQANQLSLKQSQDMDALRTRALTGDPVATKAYAAAVQASQGKTGALTQEDIGKMYTESLGAYAKQLQAAAQTGEKIPPHPDFQTFQSQILGTAQQQPVAPPGMKQVGMSGGKPVYEDANGKRVIAK